MEYLIHPSSLGRRPGSSRRPALITFSNRASNQSERACRCRRRGPPALVEQFFEGGRPTGQDHRIEERRWAMTPCTPGARRRGMLKGHLRVAPWPPITGEPKLACGRRRRPHLERFEPPASLPHRARSRRTHHDDSPPARSPDEERHTPRGARLRERADYQKSTFRRRLPGGSSSSACRSLFRRCCTRAIYDDTARCPRRHATFARWASPAVRSREGIDAWVARP